MSYVVEIIRVIRKDEVVVMIQNDDELTMIAEGENWIDFVWSCGKEQVVLKFAHGRIAVTTPTDGVWKKLQTIAQLMGASVVGEEDDLANRPRPKQGSIGVRSTWIGWPVLVLLLAGLLAWKW